MKMSMEKTSKDSMEWSIDHTPDALVGQDINDRKKSFIL